MVATVPVSAERLQPFLPEGFTAATSSGPLAAVRGSAYLGFESFECREGAGVNGSIPTMQYASVFTSADPPEDLSDESLSLQMVKWDVLVPDADRRAILEAAGFPARDGSARVAAPVAGSPLLRGEVEMAGFGWFTIEGVPTSEYGPFEGTFVEFMPGTAGILAAWRAAYEGEGGRRGTATIVMDPQSWVVQVTGETRVVGGFTTGAWTFSNATITFPVR